MRQPVTAYLGLGSNLGDRLDHLRQGVELLQSHPAIRIRYIVSTGYSSQRPALGAHASR